MVDRVDVERLNLGSANLEVPELPPFVALFSSCGC